MAVVLADKDRNVIPRWRTVTTTLTTGELDSLRGSQRAPAASDWRFFQERLDAWQGSRTTAFAGDVVGSAIVLGDVERAMEAAQFIAGDPQASSAVVSLARTILEPAAGARTSPQSDGQTVSNRALFTEIGAARRLLREHPSDTSANWPVLSVPWS